VASHGPDNFRLREEIALSKQQVAACSCLTPGLDHLSVLVQRVADSKGGSTRDDHEQDCEPLHGASRSSMVSPMLENLGDMAGPGKRTECL
jgi:hypothetical protein